MNNVITILKIFEDMSSYQSKHKYYFIYYLHSVFVVWQVQSSAVLSDLRWRSKNELSL